MDTEVYGQVPVYSRQQLRAAYAKAVKNNFDNFSPEKLVERGVMPFPNDEELAQYNESVETGLNHALSAIEDSDALELPEFFMIDTEKRDQEGQGVVWIISNGEVADFTRTPVLHVSEIGG